MGVVGDLDSGRRDSAVESHCVLRRYSTIADLSTDCRDSAGGVYSNDALPSDGRGHSRRELSRFSRRERKTSSASVDGGNALQLDWIALDGVARQRHRTTATIHL